MFDRRELQCPSGLVESTPLLERWHHVTSLSLSPGGVTTSYRFSPIAAFYGANPWLSSTGPLRNFMSNYTYLKYDKVEVRIVTTSPKNLVGGFITAMFPDNIGTSAAVFDGYTASRRIAVLSCLEQSALVDLAENGETSMMLPWSYKENYIAIPTSNPTFATKAGTPWWAMQLFYIAYTSALTDAANVQVYVRFHGLKGILPKVTAQSGLFSDIQHAAAAAAMSAAKPLAADIAASATKSAFASAKSAACYAFPSLCDSDPAAYQGFTQPEVITPSVIGATDAFTAPQKPIYSVNSSDAPFGPNGPTTINQLLQNPQYIGLLQTTGGTTSTIIAGDPISPVVNDGSLNHPTLFNYFGKLARYWAGDLILDVYVFGHPMIECVVTHSLTSATISTTTGENVNNVVNKRVVFSGSKLFKIRLPFITPASRLYVRPDINVTTIDSKYAATKINFALTVASTMTPVKPAIAAAMFLRAAPNFRFYCPIPLTMNSYATTQALLLSEAEPPIEAQCRLISQDVTADVDDGDTPIYVSGDMIELYSVEQVASLWSRLGFNPFTYPACVRDFSRGDFVSHVSAPFVFYSGAFEYKVQHDPGGVSAYEFVRYDNPNLPFAGTTTYTVTQNLGPGFSGTVPIIQPVQTTSLRFRAPTLLANVWYTFNDAPDPQDSSFEPSTNDALPYLSRRAAPGFRVYQLSLLPGLTLWANNGFALP